MDVMTQEANEAVERDFHSMAVMLNSLAKEAVIQGGMEMEDAFSEASLVYLQARQTYNGSIKLSSWVYRNVKWRLSYLRRVSARKKRLADQYRQDWGHSPWVDDRPITLEDDAEELLKALLDLPLGIRNYFTRCRNPRGERARGVAQKWKWAVIKSLGWDSRRAWRAMNQIHNDIFQETADD